MELVLRAIDTPSEMAPFEDWIPVTLVVRATTAPHDLRGAANR